MPNVFDPDFEPREEWPAGYEGRFARLGRQAGTERLGASAYELPPGQSICPYHWHAANEELLIVLRGSPTVRTPGGESQLAAGDVVAFPTGEAGAHKVTNAGPEPALVLIVSEMRLPEVAGYPDSEKVMARAPADGEELRAIFRLADRTGYWDGEAE